jgi:hypothetical protein
MVNAIGDFDGVPIQGQRRRRSQQIAVNENFHGDDRRLHLYGDRHDAGDCVIVGWRNDDHRCGGGNN